MPLETIKVCGLTRPADALAAVEAGATAVGMVFYPGSPRAVRLHEAAMIAAVVGDRALKVGVFVNESPQRIRAVAGAVRLDVVQLHGEESASICAELPGIRIWKAVAVTPDFDASSLSDYDVEAFVLDAPAGDSFGGTGRTFPWPRAREAARRGRILIAGGLDGDNVAEAIREANPWGVDASSKLEIRPGVKDPDKVRRYVEAARNAAKAAADGRS